MSPTDAVPEEEKAVEAADDLLAARGERPAEALADAPGDADGRVGAAVKGAALP